MELFQSIHVLARRIQSEQNLTVMRKLAIDYVNFIKECWTHASVRLFVTAGISLKFLQQPAPRPDGPLQFSGDHYRSLYTCFSLFVVLYLPEPGYEEAPVGEELMHWLNTHFIEPSTEEGEHLSSLKSPWEDETFWPYLTRSASVVLAKTKFMFSQGDFTRALQFFGLLFQDAIWAPLRGSPTLGRDTGSDNLIPAPTSGF